MRQREGCTSRDLQVAVSEVSRPVVMLFKLMFSSLAFQPWESMSSCLPVPFSRVNVLVVGSFGIFRGRHQSVSFAVELIEHVAFCPCFLHDRNLSSMFNVFRIQTVGFG